MKWAPLCLLAWLMIGSAKAELVAEYKLDHADAGPAEIGQIMDSAGDPPSDATQKINYPFWAIETDTGVPVPSTSTGTAPADGRAVGMTMSNGHEFGDGAQRKLTFDQGDFSIFARVFARPDGDFRIERPGTMELRFFTDLQNNNSRGVVGTITDEDGQEHTIVYADPGAENAWHDYVLVFRAGDSLEIFVDGELVNSTKTRSTKLAHSDHPFRYMNYLPPSQFLESLRIYDKALTTDEVAALSSK